MLFQDHNSMLRGIHEMYFHETILLVKDKNQGGNALIICNDINAFSNDMASN